MRPLKPMGNPVKALLIGLIRFYQRHISSHTLPSCRFMPTCSAYAIEAIQRFGALRGGALAAWRLLRCNPLGKPGYDPVPAVFPWFHRNRNRRRSSSDKPPRPGSDGRP